MKIYKIGKKLTIGIDYDGTITLDVHAFKELTNALYEKANILIITGRSITEKEKIEDFLKQVGIKYHDIYMYPKAYTSNKEWDSVRDILIANWKAETINNKDVDIVYDDHPIHINIIKKKTNALILKPIDMRHSSLNNFLEIPNLYMKYTQALRKDMNDIPEEDIQKFIEAYQKNLKIVSELFDIKKAYELQNKYPIILLSMALMHTKNNIESNEIKKIIDKFLIQNKSNIDNVNVEEENV